jgi:replicative DNA helicase
MAKNIVDIGTVLNEVVAKTYEAKDHPDGVSGVETGFRQLDKLTGGWQNSDLILLAGYHKMGTTDLMVSMALNMLENNVPLAIFSLQHSKEEIGRRLLCSRGNFAEKSLVRGELSDDEWKQLHDIQDPLYKAPLYLYDTPSPSFDQLEETLYDLVHKEQIEAVFIDCLQLIRINQPKYEEIGLENRAVTQSLKILARELNIPIVVLCALDLPDYEYSRFYGQAPAGLTDLPELADISGFADVICVLHRPEYFKIVEDETGNSTLGKAQLVVTKNHFALTGNVKLDYKASCSKFLQHAE